MPNRSCYTVVVADDEDELRQAVCTMIPWEELGFSLVGNASNGLDALELVEQLQPDLLLTDIRMPFISGIELARQVREVCPAINIAFLSGYDDFDYAKQAIENNVISYMLKPLTMEGLAQELQRIHSLIAARFRAFREHGKRQAGRDGLLLSLLLDDCSYGQTEDSLLAQARDSALLPQAGADTRFVVMVSLFRDQDGTDRTTPDCVTTVELVAEKYLAHVSVYTGGKVVTLFTGTGAEFDASLHMLTGELLQVSERALHQQCILGVSRAVPRLSDLHEAYRQAIEALTYTESDRSSLCFISDIQPITQAHAASLTDMVTNIETAFKSGNRSGLASALDALIETAHAERCDRNWLDMASLQLVADVYRALYSSMGSEALTALHAQGALPELGFRYHSPAELRDSLMDFFTCAIDLISSQQRRGGSLLCHQALEAIDQHYMEEDLSLVSLSSMLHVSPNHLSSCMKKYAGESFINILIRKRMNAAQELLLTTPMKVLEIAQQCGYSDQHYFSYCFKKYCGVSPNMLRRQRGGAL